MARNTIVSVSDDLGGKGEAATFTFSVNGTKMILLKSSWAFRMMRPNTPETFPNWTCSLAPFRILRQILLQSKTSNKQQIGLHCSRGVTTTLKSIRTE